VLDDGTVLVDSHSMIDCLDGLVPPERAMFPRTEPARRQALRVAALAMGMGDKAVSTFYETRLHEIVSQLWLDRCRAQILGVMGALEAERAARTSPYWFGERIGHADIAVAVVLRFMAEALPGLVPLAGYPALSAHAQRLEALPVFKTIAQPFVAPA
jgi:glutathione S-transferase